MTPNQQVIQAIKSKYKNVNDIVGYRKGRPYDPVRTIVDFPVVGVTLNLKLDIGSSVVFRFRKFAFFEKELLMDHFSRKLKRKNIRFNVSKGSMAVYIYLEKKQDADDIVDAVEYVLGEINFVLDQIRIVLKD